MPKFQMEWDEVATKRAVVEADSLQEAKQLIRDGACNDTAESINAHVFGNVVDGEEVEEPLFHFVVKWKELRNHRVLVAARSRSEAERKALDHDVLANDSEPFGDTDDWSIFQVDKDYRF